MQTTKKVLLSLDSKDGVFSPVEADFAIQLPGIKMHSCSHTLTRPIKNVSAISLKSVELPITSDNVRTVNYSYALWMQTFNGGDVWQPVVAVMEPGNYTTAASLVAALNTAFTNLNMISGFKPTASYNLIGNNIYKIVISWAPLANVGSYLRVSGGPTRRAALSLLGFTGDEVAVGTTVTATYGINLNPDYYYNVSIYNNQIGFTSVSNTSVGTFKVPINVTKGTIQFWTDETSFKQRREVEGSASATMNDLTVRITDRWNFDIPYLTEYSLTLEIEYLE